MTSMRLSGCVASALTFVVGVLVQRSDGGSICSSCPGDLNSDTEVDGADLGIVLAGWGLPGPADLDGSGETDGADLGALLAAWGACEAGPSCPESDHPCDSPGGPGCTLAECCTTVCSGDSYCCDVSWDALCVGIAGSLCGINVDCCMPHAGVGCSGSYCEQLVCDFYSLCCSIEWDQSCADLASRLCGQCTAKAILSVSPQTVQAGDVITVSGVNLPLDPDQVCVVGTDHAGNTVGLRALASNGTELTARVGVVPPGTGPLRVMLATGYPTVIPDLDLPPDIEVIPPGLWSWIADGTPAIASPDCFSAVPAPAGSCIELVGEVADGKLTYTIPHDVDLGSCLWVSYFEAHHFICTGHEVLFCHWEDLGLFVMWFAPCPAPDPALAIADFLVETWSEMLGSTLPQGTKFPAPTIDEAPNGEVSVMFMEPRNVPLFSESGIWNVRLCLK